MSKKDLLESLSLIKRNNQSDYETISNTELIIYNLPDSVLENSIITLNDDKTLTLNIKSGHIYIVHNYYRLILTIGQYTFEKKGYVEDLEMLINHIRSFLGPINDTN